MDPQGANMELTPFEKAEERAQQFAAKFFLYTHVNEMVARDEFLAEQLDDLRSSESWTTMLTTLKECREINQCFVQAGDFVEELDGVTA
jgi:hypothetical protein